jgi:hypothetical protein
MKKAFITFTVLFSSFAFAGDRNSAYQMICKNLSFESDRVKCAAQIKPFNYFDDRALELCTTFSFDSEKLKCLENIADKTYEAYETELCAAASFNSRKLECLKENGTPFRKTCLPKEEVASHLRTSLMDLRDRNYSATENRLMFLLTKFTEHCQN